ncbi:hypothetical protein [Glutamicibacter soli]|uniref:hypothetical protein n=1 Tax=Glutamicibacter soli TaxID=453836 RepID=UPI003FD42F48
MNTVTIHLRNGKELTFKGENLRVETLRSGSELTKINWTGLKYGDSPIFLDLSEIVAVTQDLGEAP